MKVKHLIAELEKMPQDAQVMHLWDGAARTTIEFVYLAKDGTVITSDFGQVCYSTDTRPIDAPTKEEDRYWKTPDGNDDYTCGSCEDGPCTCNE